MTTSSGIGSVSIGVTDMAVARALWVDELGLEIIGARTGPDAELGKLWNLPADAFAEQVLLRTPQAMTGYLHFVQFTHPADAVRKDAAPTDLGAKNIDVNCTDMPALVERLQAAGYQFRSEISEYDVDGLQVREVQLPVHDCINLVLIEVLGEGFELEYTAQGFAGLTSFVVIVPDAELEAGFYQSLFGFSDIMHHRLGGPAIEQAAGLPEGTMLDMRITGHPDNLFGRMELITYEGVDGDDRFKHAVPPATGILSAGFKVSSLNDFKTKAAEQGIAVEREITVDTLIGSGQLLQLQSPAGLKLDVVG